MDAEEFAKSVVGTIREIGVSGMIAQEGGQTVSGVLALFEEFRPVHGHNKRTRDGVLKSFAGEFGAIPIDSLSAMSVERWIYSRGKSESTAAKYFRYLRAFFRWAHRKRQCFLDLSEQIDAPKAGAAREVLPVATCARLADFDDEDLRLFFILSIFAGLRTEEILKLQWSDVKIKERVIHIRPGVMKDSGGWNERYVDFTEPIIRRIKWISSRAGDGPVLALPYGTFRKARVKAAVSCGLNQWPRNAGRHSFASYHLARSGNAAETAHQMGHTSPALVYRTYARAVMPSLAERFWKI